MHFPRLFLHRMNVFNCFLEQLYVGDLGITALEKSTSKFLLGGLDLRKPLVLIFYDSSFFPNGPPKLLEKQLVLSFF